MNVREETVFDREKVRTAVEKRISRLLGRCLSNLMELANGVEVENAKPDAEIKVYKRPPDRAANEYLLNRILGRPAARKPLEEPPPARPTKFDLSRVPQDRLDIMERWLTEANEQTDPPRGCG